MKRLLRHKWVVGISAIVLTLAIGAGAWAATGTDTDAGSGTCEPGTGMMSHGRGGGPMGLPDAAGLGGFRGVGGAGEALQGCEGLDMTREELRDRMQERRDRMSAQRQNVLEQAREKMSPEDQARLDGLLDTAETQRDEAKKASEQLRETLKQIRELVRGYLDDNGAGDGTGTGSSGSGA